MRFHKKFKAQNGRFSSFQPSVATLSVTLGRNEEVKIRKKKQNNMMLNFSIDNFVYLFLSNFESYSSLLSVLLPPPGLSLSQERYGHLAAFAVILPLSWGVSEVSYMTLTLTITVSFALLLVLQTQCYFNIHFTSAVSAVFIHRYRFFFSYPRVLQGPDLHFVFLVWRGY